MDALHSLFVLFFCSKGGSRRLQAHIMKRKWLALLLLVVMLCSFAPQRSALAATYATVQGGWLRLRAAPNYQAETLASYPTGSTVTVLSQANGWCHVQTADFLTGYMVRRYLRFSQDEIPNPQVWTPVNLSAQIISGNGRDVRLRSTPKVDSSNVLGLYPVGRTVMVLESSNDGWSHIRIDRKNGYMMSRFLTTGSVSPAVPVPAPSPYVPFIPSNVLNSASLSNTAPSVGETITILVSPAAAEYTAIWYRDDNQLLSTNSWYTVGMLDLGHVHHWAGAFSRCRSESEHCCRFSLLIRLGCPVCGQYQDHR